MALLAELGGDWWAYGVAGAAVLPFCWYWRRYRWLTAWLVLLASSLLGFGYAGQRAEDRLGGWLPIELAGRDIAISGRVAGLPRRGPAGERFLFIVDAVDAEAATALRVPERLWLARYPSREAGDIDSAAERQRPFAGGERWALTVRLKPPHGSANPGGFDYEAWLLERGIGATGYVRERPAARHLGDAGGLAAAVDRVRESIRGRLYASLSGAAQAGVLVALAIGDQDAIDDEGWAVFNRTGTTHLMSISGLHVTLLGTLVAALVAWLWRRLPPLVARVPVQRAALSCGAIAALGYATLAGFGIPAQRTVLMLAVVVGALLLRRSVPGGRILLLALSVVLTADPWAVLAPGFWLSFGTVAALMSVSGGRRRSTPAGWRARAAWALGGFGRSQWAATLATLPILAFAFQRLSLISPLANALAIPVIGFLVAPLAVLAAILPFAWLAQLAHALLVPLLELLSFLSGLPWAALSLPAVSVPATLLATAAVVLLLLPSALALRLLALPLLLPLAFPKVETPAPGDAWIDVLDVGHGLSVVVRTSTRTLLFDAGPAAAGRFDAGERVVLPALRGLGMRRLDALVVSHEDNDHAGGAAAVLREMPLGGFYGSLPDGHPLLADGRSQQRCIAGHEWRWDGVSFRFLHPAVEAYGDPKRKRNRLSCVLRVESAGGVGFLITADLEAPDERRLVRDTDARLASQAMLVPHQGSRSSSTAEFVAAVAPTVAVAPVGFLNRYAHPHPDVVSRYAAIGAQLWRTDRDGAVSLRLGSALHVSGWRNGAPRYWRRGGTIAGLSTPGDEE